MTEHEDDGRLLRIQAPKLNLAAPERVEPPPILNLLPPKATVEPEMHLLNLPAPELVVETPPILNLAAPERVEPEIFNLSAPKPTVEPYNKGNFCSSAPRM